MCILVKYLIIIKILKLKGEEEITLNKNEVLILSSAGGAINLINEKLKSNRRINIKGKEYLIKNDKVIEENLKTSSLRITFAQ